MTQDNTKHIREIRLRAIQKSETNRSKEKNYQNIHIPPKFNFSPQHYPEIINWIWIVIYLLFHYYEISVTLILNHICQSDSIPNWDIPLNKFPVHTQATERCVTLGKPQGNVSSEPRCSQDQLCITSAINQISNYLQLRIIENRDIQLFQISFLIKGLIKPKLII